MDRQPAGDRMHRHRVRRIAHSKNCHTGYRDSDLRHSGSDRNRRAGLFDGQAADGEKGKEEHQFEMKAAMCF